MPEMNVLAYLTKKKSLTKWGIGKEEKCCFIRADVKVLSEVGRGRWARQIRNEKKRDGPSMNDVTSDKIKIYVASTIKVLRS